VGLLGLIGTQGGLAWPVDRVRQFGDRTKAHAMPIDPARLARSIATLTDLDPERDLTSTLQQAVVAAKQLFAVDAAGIMLADADSKLRWASASDPLAQSLEDNQETFAAGPCLQAFTTGRPAVVHDATLEPHWGEITLAFVELQIQSGLSVPVELGGGPIGTLDVYAAAPGGWDQTEISALQTYAGLVATMLGTAAKVQATGRLAEQLQVALAARRLIDQSKDILVERERLDDQQAFIDLRQAARSSRHAPPEVAAFLEQRPGADGIGHKLSQLLLGFLGTEVVPLANRLAGLGVDPTPLFAATSGILRLYADTMEHPDVRR
jgi:putative methionine-R-sulfoxide reductase with GAF domain